MKKILVIGASGFVGKALARQLFADGYGVRCLARKPAKVEDLVTTGCEVVQGDISVPESMQQALQSVDAVYISIHTLAPQHSNTAGQNFMDVEMNGLQNIITACQSQGVRRIIYVTFLGAAPDAQSAWVRGRWQAEQFLLNSGLDVTVIRPGMIIGIGGQGFNMTLSNAKKRLAILMGSGRQKYRCIAIDDLAYYLAGVLENRQTYGRCYDVGNDDVLNNNEVIDVVAGIIGRKHPAKLHIPLWPLKLMAPLIEHMAKMPKGAVKGILDTIPIDSVGDPMPIRSILSRPLMTARQAIERALAQSK